MLGDFARAVGQMGDARFQRVLAMGLGLTIALLIGFYLAVVWLVGWAVPDTITLPLVGQVTFLQTLAEGASLLAAIALSTLLMVPVASAFTGLFLDAVADAVERQHYPQLPPAPGTPFLTALGDSLAFLGVLVVANLLALFLYILFPPFAPLIFWALNGYLLGREYFHLVALRRMPADAARAMRRRHAGQIWLAGGLMAVPLSVPLLNLLVPILGAATFTHLFHRLAASPDERELA
ncbi:MAG: EI24 domain-containing protein [Pseudomonadota bacterium]